MDVSLSVNHVNVRVSSEDILLCACFKSDGGGGGFKRQDTGGGFGTGTVVCKSPEY